MRSTVGRVSVGLAALVWLAVAVPADAKDRSKDDKDRRGRTVQTRARDDDRDRRRRPVQTQLAYDNGYREGVKRGEQDARGSRAADPARAGEFRKAEKGYKRDFGSRETYQRLFRQGYISGYNDAYYARSAGRGRVPGRYAGPSHDRRPRAVPRHPDDRYPTPRGTVGFDSAYETGFHDGYQKGRDDARSHNGFRATHHPLYRSADRGYDGRYRSRQDYQQIYREGFRSGYEEGYRLSDGRDERGGRGWWPF